MASYLNKTGIVTYNYLKASFAKEIEDDISKKIKVDGFDITIETRLIDG